MPPENRSGFADVSVVIPAYNAEATIGRALRSVAGQTTKPKEAVVVVDGSDDTTREAAEACREHMNGVGLTVVTQSNAGAGAARNRAIAESCGRYLAFLDADDEWLPEKLARCLSAIEDGNLDFLCHNVIFVTVEGKEVLLDSHRTYHRYGDPFLACFLRGFISTPTVIAGRDCVIAAGGFNPDLQSGQDFELWLSIFSDPAVRADVLPDALAKYHEAPAGITRRISERIACARRIVRAHAHELRGRVPLPMMTVLERMLIIDYQAITGYLRLRRYSAALLAASLIPIHVLGVPFMGHRRLERGDFLSGRSAP